MRLWQTLWHNNRTGDAMSYNGSGTFQINTTGQPVVAGTVISSTAFNALTADLATGLSTAITKDGQTATTARIPFAAGINSTLVTDSTSTSTGSIITAGGVGVAKALYVGTTANIAGASTFTGAIAVDSVTDSSSTTTGSIQTDGGLGVAKAVFIGTTLNVASTTTLTGVATLTANPVLSAGTANGVTYLNGSKSLTSGAAITFDGTNFATTGTATATKLIPTGTSVTGNGLYLPAANSLGLSTNGTNAVYIDSSQNVGIGTSSPAGNLQISGGGDRSLLVTGGTSGTISVQLGDSAAAGQGGMSYDNSVDALFFKSNGSERMRIDSSGNVLIGQTSASNSVNGMYLSASGGGAANIVHASGTASNTAYANFLYAGSIIGSIVQSGTAAVLYNVTSDQRLKENIVDAPDFGSIIDSIQVRSFDWKTDNTHQRAGFVAQELVIVAPEAVHQPANSDEMMAVDYSKLVPMLVKEIQSLRQRLAAAGI